MQYTGEDFFTGARGTGDQCGHLRLGDTTCEFKQMLTIRINKDKGLRTTALRLGTARRQRQRIAPDIHRPFISSHHLISTATHRFHCKLETIAVNAAQHWHGMSERLGEFLDLFQQTDVSHQANDHQPRTRQPLLQVVECGDR